MTLLVAVVVLCLLSLLALAVVAGLAYVIVVGAIKLRRHLSTTTVTEQKGSA